MGLELHRTTNRRAPWVLRVSFPDGQHTLQLPHGAFRRKREAVALLRALAALQVPWETDPDTWEPALREQVVALVYGAPQAQEAEAFAQARYAALVTPRRLG